MKNINSLDDKRFTLDGIQYFRNYVSVVRGNRVELFNCYERKDVLIPLTSFTEFTVDGETFGSAAALQEALIEVTYSRDTGSGTSTQNNTGRYITIGVRRGVSLPATPAALAQYINQNAAPPGSLSGGFMTISESNTPVFLSSTVNTGGAYYNHIFVFNGGKGTWGNVPEGTAVTAGQFRLISVTALSPDDVPTDNIIALGDIDSGGFLTAANSQSRNFTDTEKSYYFSHVTDDVLYLSLFTGNPGIYGGGNVLQLQNSDFATLTNSNTKPIPAPTLEQILTAEGSISTPLNLSTAAKKTKLTGEGVDYTTESSGKIIKMRFAEPLADITHTIPAKAANDTFAMLSDLNCWKAVTISADGNSIQNNALIGAASVDMIASSNQLFTTGFTFNPATGTISGWEVFAGEKHIIFYSKS